MQPNFLYQQARVFDGDAASVVAASLCGGFFGSLCVKRVNSRFVTVDIRRKPDRIAQYKAIIRLISVDRRLQNPQLRDQISIR